MGIQSHKLFSHNDILSYNIMFRLISTNHVLKVFYHNEYTYAIKYQIIANIVGILLL